MGSDNFRQVGTFDFTEGLELQFLEQPPLSPVPINLSVTKDSQKNQLLQNEVNILIQKGVLEEVNPPFHLGFQFLGEHFRTDLGLVLPPEEKVVKVCQLVNALTQFSSVPARQLLQLVGFLISIMDVIPLGRLHSSNPVVSDGVLASISQLWEAPVPILPRLLPHLQWWLQEKHLRKGVLLDPPDPSLTLFTDASLMGWGAYLEGRTASGLWSGAQLEEHINLLEMRAVFLSLRQFQAVIQGQSLLVATDNSTVVAYLQNQGGTHSFSLYHLSKEILLLCHSLNIFLSVRHVPGSQNLLADALSRSRVPVNTEWEIHPSVFQEIILRWDRPHIDLFATSLNHKLETYVSPIPDEKAWAVDAMTLSWKGMFSYMFLLFVFFKDLAQDSEGSLQDHSYCSGLVKTVLVPRTTTSVLCKAPLFASKREDLLSQFKGRKLHQAKNQLPDKGSGIITIPALPPTSDNQVLCPVRALLVYLASSAKLRSAGSSRLFIPIKKGISDISAKTISTWICNTVILAYKSASSEVLVKHQVKAHEVRALASSWNIFNSSSMSEIMSAGFWRSDSAFYNHYLRSMPLHCDNLYSLGPLVAAQQVVFPPPSDGDSALR
ncbi:unnamed protein product [Mytilus edulis]|uniref:Uncharacterized protein n=1 Tax=Mytilus edulis TaxID=6550 RepID=A0A8S3US33_MYTED|nr:unnamed protein product [Mytilus edulis]